MAFIPHTPEDVAEMLAAIGVTSIEQLFDEIPASVRAGELSGVPEAMSEMEIGKLMMQRAGADGLPLSFIGAGAYEHHIPAAVWAIATRGEFYSAYTPYQAEASQGTLQTIYEFQTMIASLTGMAVANASLYDGASAFAEALLMAVRIHRKSSSLKILVPRAVHPHYRDAARAITSQQGLKLEELAYDPQSGRTPLEALQAHEGADISALAIQQPNFFGVLEDADALSDWARSRGMPVIAIVNPTSLALLRPPGEWRGAADIVVGEGQPLGVPLSSGGPYFGFMASRMEHVRQMPGRIVGRTLDVANEPGFTLTLQAREQHIRRGRATSNICTNQGLMVTAATVYLSLMGPRGLERVAAACHARTRELHGALCRIEGVRAAFTGPYFHECVLQLDRPVAPVLDALAARDILGGFDLTPYYPELGHALLACATETKTSADIRTLASALRDALQAQHAA
ncbi:MAG TPA: aminomethyl-transferring glycine dehydrogenase subunit GcvPA [Steroidobacteraceae bacterium]|jgi:glycine dehydrogenase subunit 1|nr:aminomethyl-transferring glycine dehydrogenase subunit GcvPA [Steroidobacteraceae bacterium]